MRWLLVLAVIATAAAGCAYQGLDRAAVDADAQARCVRTGGLWYGDNQFGGSCRYEGRWQ